MPDTATALSFTEEMKGYVTLGETDYDRGYRKGRDEGVFLMFHLTIRMQDVALFIAEKTHLGSAEGYVKGDVVGGERRVERGIFNLFVDGANPRQKRMLYRLFFHDDKDNPLTLIGFKDVREDHGCDVWADTTTLFTRILRGHVEEGSDAFISIFSSN